jgi:hypothetical protein
MNLVNLAPDIQEAILFLPRAPSGRDPFAARQMRRIVETPGHGGNRDLDSAGRPC